MVSDRETHTYCGPTGQVKSPVLNQIKNINQALLLILFNADKLYLLK
jgi:hypothetical protein